MISFTCVLKAKWHLFLSRLGSTSRETILWQKHSPSSSLNLFRLTIPIMPQPRAVLLAYGSSSLPGMISCGLIARVQLVPISIPTSTSSLYGMSWSATDARWGQLRAVSGLGICPLLAGILPREYVSGRWMLIASLNPWTTNPLIFSHVTTSSARTVDNLSCTLGPFTESFFKIVSLTKQASDWSSRRAYVKTLVWGLSSWLNHTGTMREWERHSACFPDLEAATQREVASASGVVEACLFAAKESSCSMVACGPLQVLQLFLFRQSLRMWPHARHPWQRPLAWINCLLSWSEIFINSLHASRLCAFLQKWQNSFFFILSSLIPLCESCFISLESVAKHFLLWNLWLLLFAASWSLLTSSSLVSLLEITGLHAILDSLFKNLQKAEKGG